MKGPRRFEYGLLVVAAILIYKSSSNFVSFSFQGLPPNKEVNDFCRCSPAGQSVCGTHRQFSKFIWFATDGYSFSHSDSWLPLYKDHSLVYTISVPAPRWSHWIYTSWYTGLQPSNWWGSEVKGDSLFHSMYRAAQPCPGPKFSFIDCVDNTTWVDRDGDPCPRYESVGRDSCVIAEKYAVDGVDATQACCFCGGGSKGEPNRSSLVQYNGPVWSCLGLLGGEKKTVGWMFSSIAKIKETDPWTPQYLTVNTEEKLQTKLSSLKENNESIFLHTGILDKRNHLIHAKSRRSFKPVKAAAGEISTLFTDWGLKEFIDENPEYVLIISSDHGGTVLRADFHGDEHTMPKRDIGFFSIYNPHLTPTGPREIGIVDVAPLVSSLLEGIDIPLHSLGRVPDYFGATVCGQMYDYLRGQCHSMNRGRGFRLDGPDGIFTDDFNNDTSVAQMCSWALYGPNEVVLFVVESDSFGHVEFEDQESSTKEWRGKLGDVRSIGGNFTALYCVLDGQMPPRTNEAEYLYKRVLLENLHQLRASTSHKLNQLHFDEATFQTVSRSDDLYEMLDFAESTKTVFSTPRTPIHLDVLLGLTALSLWWLYFTVMFFGGAKLRFRGLRRYSLRKLVPVLVPIFLVFLLGYIFHWPYFRWRKRGTKWIEMGWGWWQMSFPFAFFHIFDFTLMCILACRTRKQLRAFLQFEALNVILRICYPVAAKFVDNSQDMLTLTLVVSAWMQLNIPTRISPSPFNRKSSVGSSKWGRIFFNLRNTNKSDIAVIAGHVIIKIFYITKHRTDWYDSVLGFHYLAYIFWPLVIGFVLSSILPRTPPENFSRGCLLVLIIMRPLSLYLPFLYYQYVVIVPNVFPSRKSEGPELPTLASQKEFKLHSDHRMNGSDSRVNGCDQRMNGSDHRMNGSDQRMNGSGQQKNELPKQKNTSPKHELFVLEGVFQTLEHWFPRKLKRLVLFFQNFLTEDTALFILFFYFAMVPYWIHTEIQRDHLDWEVEPKTGQVLLLSWNEHPWIAAVLMFIAKYGTLLYGFAMIIKSVAAIPATDSHPLNIPGGCTFKVDAYRLFTMLVFAQAVVFCLLEHVMISIWRKGMRIQDVYTRCLAEFVFLIMTLMYSVFVLKTQNEKNQVRSD